MNRTKHSIQNSIWGISYRVLHIIFPVLQRGLIIREIGVAYVGLGGLFKSILNVLNLSELGFGAAIVYMMYKPIAENDLVTIRALLSLLRRIYRWVGLIMLCAGLAIVPFLRYLVKNDTGTDVNIYVLYGMYLFHTVMSYWLFSYKSTLFTAHQRADITYKIMFFCGVLQYGFQMIVLITLKNYYIYLLVFALLIIPQNLMYQRMSKKEYPNLYCEGQATKEQIKVITTKIKSLFGHSLGNTVIFSIDSVIISAFIGVTILAKYDNYNYIISSLVTLLTVFQTSILASVGNKMCIDSTASIYALFKRLSFLWIGLVGWCSTCLLSLYQPFITVWVGEEYLFSNALVVCIALYFFTWQFRQIGLVMKNAAGLWEADKWKPYIGMVLNLVLSILFVKFTGNIAGVLIPTMFVLVFVYYPWETHVLFKNVFHRSSGEYWLLNFRFIAAALIAGGATYLVCQFIPVQGIPCILVRGILCVIIMPVVYAGLNFKTKQMKESIGMLRHILSRYMVIFKRLNGT